MSHNKDPNKGENDDANNDKDRSNNMDQNDKHVTSSAIEDEHGEHVASSPTEDESSTNQPDEKPGDMSP